MRTIYVTGGRTGYATGTFTDKRGNDLAGATLRMAVTTTATPPAKDATTWRAPDLSTGTGPTRELSLLLDETIAPPGTYRLWVDYADTPESQPVLASNMLIRTL